MGLLPAQGAREVMSPAAGTWANRVGVRTKGENLEELWVPGCGGKGMTSSFEYAFLRVFDAIISPLLRSV